MDKLKVYDIMRTDRKTIALIVNSDATLTVRAPHRTSVDSIERVIRKKYLWITEKRRQAVNRPKAWRKEFVSGESFLYLGKSYKLRVTDQVEEDFVFRGGFYLAKSVRYQARQLFIKWYKDAAERKIAERADWYAKRMGVTYDRSI